MAGRAAHVAVYRDSRIDEEEPTESDPLFRYRSSGGTHVPWERLKNLLCFFEKGGVLVGRYCRADSKYRDAARKNNARAYHGSLHLGTLGCLSSVEIPPGHVASLVRMRSPGQACLRPYSTRR